MREKGCFRWECHLYRQHTASPQTQMCTQTHEHQYFHTHTLHTPRFKRSPRSHCFHSSGLKLPQHSKPCCRWVGATVTHAVLPDTPCGMLFFWRRGLYVLLDAHVHGDQPITRSSIRRHGLHRNHHTPLLPILSHTPPAQTSPHPAA